jgi:hypothetical protein
MPKRVPSKWWRRTKICLSALRVILLLLVLLVVTVVVYLNEVGLPGFAKRPIIDALHARGFDLEVGSIRWRWYRGLVAENVRFGSAQPEANIPQMSLRELALQLNHHALVRFHLKVDLLTLRTGQLTWLLAETNQPPESLVMTNIQAQLRLLPDDQWELDHFTAAFAGAHLHLSGSLTNASAIRDWKFIHGHGGGEPEALRRRLRELARTIDSIRFASPPELNVIIRGDAREFQSFSGLITLEAPAAHTPWGDLSNGTLLTRLTGSGETNGLSKAEFILRADEVSTRWGSTKHFQLDLHASGDDNLTNLVRAHVEVSAAQFTTPWAQATNAQFTARWTHSLTNPIPIAGSGELRLANPYTRWGHADELRLDASLSTPATNGPRADASWAWWAPLAPYYLDWNCRLENLRAEDFKSQTILCAGNWRAPELTITNLHTEMYQGQVTANADLNVASRMARFAFVSDFDVQKAVPFLSPKGREWFAQQEFSWQNPPTLRGSGYVTLPAWTNHHPDWREEVLPTFFIQGDFKVGEGSYHKLPVTSARSHLTYSNMVCNIPDLEAVRPEGKIGLAMTADDRTREYYFNIHSTVDLKILRVFAPEKAQRAVDFITFTQMPRVNAEVWGHWRDYDHIGARAEITLTNFTFRGQAMSNVHGWLAYTNKFLLLTNGRLERSNEVATCSSIGFDFPGKRAFLTNGFSTMETFPGMQMIGPKVARDVEPYHFLVPPTVEANGVIPLSDDIDVADLHFKMKAGPFRWLKFHGSEVNTLVDWVGQKMTLNQLEAHVYDGTITASAAFDFSRPGDGADFKFDMIATGINLQKLMSDVSPATNHLEGVFNGHLNVTYANTQDDKSWCGSGQVDLRNGLIWDIPIFGVLSPVLDSVISPGLGESRINQASANFTMTNSVLHSDDLLLRSPTVRLLYRGTVGFDMQVDATVEAEVGRDAPLVGPVVSTVFMPCGKLFETRVTGSLTNPKRAPVTLAAKLISPFIHPLRTLKDLLPGESSSTTNTPPVFPDPPPAN